jgi:drug/metabolite transporter (DMT)-like permease
MRHNDGLSSPRQDARARRSTDVAPSRGQPDDTRHPALEHRRGRRALHLDSAHSFEVTFWRSLFNALALGCALSLLRGPGSSGAACCMPAWPLWFSGFCWSVMFTAFMLAITLTSVANVLVTMAIGPLITALFARLFLQHRLPARTWLAIAVAGVGIAWMFGQEAKSGLSLTGSVVALAVPLAAALNFTTLQHVAHRAAAKMRPMPQDMLPAVLIGAVLSAACTLPLAWPLQATSA